MNDPAIETAEILLINGANPNQKTSRGLSPLHMIVDCMTDYDIGEEEKNIFHMLLAFGADINTQDDYGDTPLYEAARQSDCGAVCFLLLQNGADMHRLNNRGRTPYMVAKPSNKPVFDRWLLQDKCDAFNTVLHQRAGRDSAYHDLTPELVGNIRRLTLI
jgi:ankyrin repeat protein